MAPIDKDGWQDFNRFLYLITFMKPANRILLCGGRSIVRFVPSRLHANRRLIWQESPGLRIFKKSKTYSAYLYKTRAVCQKKHKQINLDERRRFQGNHGFVVFALDFRTFDRLKASESFPNSCPSGPYQ